MQTGIVLQVAENIVQNIALQVGSVTETVEVQAAASMVETKENSISQVIEQQQDRRSAAQRPQPDAAC